MENREIYISVDVETVGPVPGVHSMIALGAAAFLPPDEKPFHTFRVNIQEGYLSDGFSRDSQTMQWWKRFPDVWDKITANAISPEKAMKTFDLWLQGLGSRYVFMGWPVTFDYGFVNYYFEKYVGYNPFGIAALDLKTMAYILMNGELGYRETCKKEIPEMWLEGTEHTHDPLVDAIGQGVLFVRMWKTWRKIK